MLRGQSPSAAPGALPATRSERDGYALRSTGETVYGDVPLRFRNLTLAAADLPAIADADHPPPGFKIRISKMRRGRLQAGTLVTHRYEGEGYHTPSVGKEPALHTFIAYDEGQLVGTVSVRLDSRRGLAADELYGEATQTLRSRGYRLCEFTRLAVDKTVASKPVLAGLFHTAYLFAAVLRGCTHAVIEVTPQHSGFYRRALKFERIGDVQLNPRVNTNGVLMYVAFSTIAEALRRYAGRPESEGAGHSLFVHGFPPDEEAGVLTRLRDVVDE